MKFHELVQHHNIDYKFHDIQDLHPVFEKSNESKSLPESRPSFSQLMKFFYESEDMEKELQAFQTFRKQKMIKKYVASVLNMEKEILKIYPRKIWSYSTIATNNLLLPNCQTKRIRKVF